jgi:hypothetical protein
VLNAFIEKIRTVAQQSDFADQTMRGTPAVAGAAASVWTLNTWVMIFTGVYVLLQIAYLVRKWWREERDNKKRRPHRS